VQINYQATARQAINPPKVAQLLRQPAEERLKEAERVTALKPSETG